ncbi:hypothetical protein [Parachlamydia sp. AcF125]|uniref:hypothetical protein n=1 Tax=Parachlamydia sp. AcF125 TaxID=2795736 RepID=UPI001BCA4B70|nr:hypothetical protein [Parachlamydia sp. AcF125]MBS4167868.1 hypothetical protein [Parachlamydia sp. AcF125]
MSIIHFQEKLETTSGKKLILRFNNNRSTMLSVKWGEPDCVVSLHSFFLEAPQNVMDALACYIKQEHKKIAPSIKTFIEDNLKKLDYSHQIDPSKLSTQGKFYDLQAIYNELNAEYFNGEVKAAITWYNKQSRKNSSTVTFGLYHHLLRLIKINRMLDASHIPAYFVSFVVYHEMLHEACPSYVDKKGINRIHSKEFREREVLFKDYFKAKKWVDQYLKETFA